MASKVPADAVGASLVRNCSHAASTYLFCVGGTGSHRCYVSKVYY